MLLAYEWGWQGDGYFEVFGTDLVLSGFGDRLDMYRYLPTKHYSKLMGYLWENYKKKKAYISGSGVYSAESFDEKGRMILERHQTCLEYEGNEERLGRVNVGKGEISEATIGYLKKYKAFVQEKGAEIYFVAPPIYEGAVTGNYEGFERLIRREEEIIGIDYISNPQDYFFPKEFIFDTPYHCTNEGETHRTELLISDLKVVLK